MTGYWVEDLGYWQIEIMQFFKKGTRIGERLDTDPSHSMLKRIANAIFNRYYEILSPEDGFYYLSYDNLNDAQLKKHPDIITHWMPLPEGPKPEN